jgi:PAS domain S-box-containing protein
MMTSVFDQTGNALYRSPSHESIIGYSPSELESHGKFELIHPDDKNQVAELFADLKANPGSIVEVKARYKHKHGGWRWIRAIGKNMVDNDDVGGIVINGYDITKRVNNTQKLEQQKKRLEEFSTTIAHDIRNPLNVVRGNIEDLQQDCQDSRLEVAKSAVESVDDLTESVLILAKKGMVVSEPQCVSLEPVCRKTWKTMNCPESTLKIRGDLPTILADEERLREMVQNLLGNAIEHNKNPVTVTIGQLDEIGFYIEDDGEGLPVEKKEQLLEQGYTTSDEGTGLGLTIVETICEAHGWKLHLTEGDNKGFRVEIQNVSLPTPEDAMTI